MSVLITSDLHFTDNLLDTYRWDFFSWLREEILENKVTEIYVLGDLTEKKDGHSSLLTNRVVSEFRALKSLARVFILKGNHDFVDQDLPFFSFLDGESNIRFISEIFDGVTDLGKVLFVPYQGIGGYSKLKEIFLDKRLDQYDYVFMHDSVLGATLSSGIFLKEGMPPSWFDSAKPKIYSGHIHIPQTIGNVEYIGSPYPVYFGDSYSGRAVIISDAGRAKDIHYPCLKRGSLKISSLRELYDYGLKKGDQVKIKFMLGRSEFSEWSDIQGKVKEWCSKEGVLLCSLELVSSDQKESFQDSKPDSFSEKNSDTLERFSDLESLDDDFRKIGLSVMGYDK